MTNNNEWLRSHKTKFGILGAPKSEISLEKCLCILSLGK